MPNPAVSAELRQRWHYGAAHLLNPQAGVAHVGSAKPSLSVRVRKMVMDRAYRPFDQYDFGQILKGNNTTPWQAYLRVLGDWIDVPNVVRFTRDRALDSSNGVSAFTIEIENVILKEMMGALGVFHMVSRGHMSPQMGVKLAGRPPTDQATNEWLDVFNGGFMIEIKLGYGNAVVKTVNGLIDDCDIGANPDRIVLTCRDFGVMLTDSPIVGINKAKEIRSPITFCDRDKADEVTVVSGGAKASSAHLKPGKAYPAKNVTRRDTTKWLSLGHAGPNNTEWIEIHVPKGRYSDFYIYPAFGGMEMWVSVYARSRGLRAPANLTMDGETIDGGWVDGGVGNVPGEAVPFLRHWKKVDKKGQRLKFKHEFNLGDDSVIRVWFRNLGKSTQFRDYRAGAQRLASYRRTISAEAKAKKWILIDDVADMAKYALMWAGFKQWEVEEFGAPIVDPVTFDQSHMLMDIINYVTSQGNYVFFMQSPTDDDLSIGVPTLRRTRAIEPPGPGLEEVRDTDLLEQMSVKWSKDPLPFIIKSRGKDADKKHGGQSYEGDLTRRVHADYFPPWSGAHRRFGTDTLDAAVGRLGGVIKYDIHSDSFLATNEDCKMACILIAIQQILSAVTFQAQVAGFPGFELDDQISLVDHATGTNARGWMANIHDEVTIGAEGKYVTTVSGSLIDTEDMLMLGIDYQAMRALVDAGRTV